MPSSLPWWDRRRQLLLAGELYTLVRRESLSSSESVVFLKHLLVQTGKKLLVI